LAHAVVNVGVERTMEVDDSNGAPDPANPCEEPRYHRLKDTRPGIDCHPCSRARWLISSGTSMAWEVDRVAERVAEWVFNVDIRTFL
jgi:hypothetical protein